MLSYIEYQLISLMLPIAIGLLSSIAVFIGGLILKPKQLVRLVFPYVKKRTDKNQKTVLMFHYKLSNLEVGILFSIVLLVVFSATFIFVSSFTQVSYKYNPYDSFDCFFTSNDSLVESSPEEALELEESVICFNVKFNIARAMGEASATLAILWIFSSIMTWISVKIKKESKSSGQPQDQKNKEGQEDQGTQTPAERQDKETQTEEESQIDEESQSDTKYCHSFRYILLIIIFYIFATVLSLSLIIAGALAFARQFTNLLSSVEIMACGLILALQLIPLIVSDVIYIYSNSKEQTNRKHPDKDLRVGTNREGEQEIQNVKKPSLSLEEDHVEFTQSL